MTAKINFLNNNTTHIWVRILTVYISLYAYLS